MTGEQIIAAPRLQVWQALNDADVLKHCIPGCQSLERESEQRLRAMLALKVGPIGARFTSVVALSDVDAPNAYTITMEGQGGTAGNVNGSAKVRLTEEGAATLLAYEVSARVSGRLAQLGGPLIDATAKQLASSFFKKFAEKVTSTVSQTAAQ